MKILVIGSGGREHAIVWALKKTAERPVTIYCAPGNAGIARDAETVPIPVSDHKGLISFAQTQGIDLTFVGPEAPLVAGIVDDFEAAGLAIVGPRAQAARLEGSKVFAKDFMARHKIPTARYRTATSSEEAIEYLRSPEFGSPESSVVVKADGLAAGKGVFVAKSHEEAERAVADLMVAHVAGREAATRIILEEALEGLESSLLLFADGTNYVLMPAARDHKRIGEGDTGPNTGGMGSITGNSILTDEQVRRVVTEIVEPTLKGARDEGFPFKGILFVGLMLTDSGPKVLEYNVRFGDPETQAILVRLKTDLVAIFDAIRRGTLRGMRVEWAEGASACVVAANRGYPGKYDSGAVIGGCEEAEIGGVQVFHAGTSLSDTGELLATGGRVLGVTAAAESLTTALAACYSALEIIHWSGMQFRRDIGKSKPAFGTAG